MRDLIVATAILDASRLLERCSQPSLSSGDRHSCARMASRLRNLLAERTGAVPDDVASAAEARWAKHPGVKLELPIKMRTDEDGVFVLGWLRAAEPLDRRDGAMALEAALAAMPVVAREVFVLHRRDDLSFEAIAGRLALTLNEVAEQFLVALLAISTENRRRVAARGSSKPKS